MTSTQHDTQAAPAAAGEQFEPKIIAFCCNWCSYAGADLAGVSRLQMPTNFRIIRVMCSGRVDPLFVLKALEEGADGVLLMGCHPGDCHYISGNMKAQRRARFLSAILDHFDLGKRFELHWVSASEGPMFQSTISEFVDKIRKLGPSPVAPVPRHIMMSKESQKRKYIHSVLVSLAEMMDNGLDEPLEMWDDDVMEGYGFPIWDADKCIGCGACQLNCPEKVIQLDDRKGLRYIGHNPFDCRTCRICEEVCPQDAIQIRRGFILGQFLSEDTVDGVRMSLRSCSSCGEEFSTERQLEAICAKLAEGDPEKGVPGMELPARIFELCPKCRQENRAKM